MTYLLDTNVICELVKPKPHAAVVEWVNAVENSALYISVLTLGEIRKGMAGIADVKRHRKIAAWLEKELPAYFEDRILMIDCKVADVWGQLQSDNKARPLPAIDGLIAATALTHQLTLVTRNIKDFFHASVELVNPWEI